MCVSEREGERERERECERERERDLTRAREYSSVCECECVRRRRCRRRTQVRVRRELVKLANPVFLQTTASLAQDQSSQCPLSRPPNVCTGESTWFIMEGRLGGIFFKIYIYKNSKYKTKGGRFCLAVDYTKSMLTFKRVLTPNLNSCTRERERESLCVCASEKEKGVRVVMQ